MNSDSILVLFCSTLRPQYAQDVLNVTAYPEGSILHFRYRAKWVSENILGAVTDTLIGADILCCLVDGADESTPESQLRYVPLRFGNLVELEKEGGVLHIYFRLSRYVHWEVPFGGLPSDRQVDEQIASLVERATTTLRSEIPSTLRPQSKFCVLAKIRGLLQNGLDDTTEPTQSWQSLITVLSHIRHFREAVFFKVDALESFPTWRRWYERMKQIDRGVGLRSKPTRLPVQTVEYLSTGFEIKRVAMHALKISYFQPHEVAILRKPKYIIAIGYDGGYFLGKGQELDVLSRVDKVRTTLYPTVGTYVATAPLTLKVMEKVSGSSSDTVDKRESSEKTEFMAPEVTITLKILHPRRALWTALGLFAAGAVFHFGLNAALLPFYREITGWPTETLDKVLPVVGTAIGYAFYLSAIVSATRRPPTNRF